MTRSWTSDNTGGDPLYTTTDMTWFDPKQVVPDDWSKTKIWPSPTSMPPSLEDLKKVLSACIVCGEDGFILCDMCQSAVLQARKDMLQGMLFDIMEMEGKDEMKLHQGTTNTGGLVHAVQLIRRGEYVRRALCGVKVIDTTARYFASADNQCARCKNSATKLAS